MNADIDDEMDAITEGVIVIKPQVVERLKAWDHAPLPCPLCGRPSTRFGGGCVSEPDDRWHTRFRCENPDCGFGYVE